MMSFFSRISIIFAVLTGATLAQKAVLKIDECREQGFDPMRLACSTCDLLPVDHQPACKACCQSYMDLSHRRTRPYEAAVLVHSSANLGMVGGGSPRSSGSAEIDELLEDTEEWERLVNEKGGEQRLQVLKRTVGLPKGGRFSGGNSQELVQELMKGGPPAEVLLMDEKLPRGGELVYDDLHKQAAEVISLQGSSKDDIKDLLMTLLP
jgi:hypothetical protein